MELIDNILKSLEGFNGARSIKQKARATVELSIISANADRIAEQYKDSLIEKKVYELFPEYELKCEYTAPKLTSYIDATKLAKALIKADRVNDLLKIISISEKALSALADGEELAGKYRMSGDKTKAGVKVSKMTKAEVKASNPSEN